VVYSDMSFERCGYVGACLEFMFRMQQVLPLYYVIKFYKGVAGCDP
jgi:hypothetical protein